MVKKVTIKDLATALDVSIGTVDRALHNRPGINAETRERVLAQAKIMGYETNLIARSLSRKHQLRIGCVFPAEYRFYPDIEAGINAAYESLVDHNVQIISMKTERLADGKEADCVYRLLDIGIHGLAICPGHRSLLNDAIDEVVDAGIPVVTIATDAPESKRLTCVSTDSFNNGQIAGDLMVNLLNQGGRVAIINGYWEVTDHSEKVRGFMDAINLEGYGIEVVDIIETGDDPDIAFEETKALLNRDIDGIYVNTASATLGCGRALAESQQFRDIRLLGTDLLKDSIPYIEQGIVRAVIFQDPFMQGYRAIRILFDAITTNRSYGPTDFMRPTIITKHNIPYFQCYS